MPATLAARVRLLRSVKASNNDQNDALSTAIAGLRHDDLRRVGLEDHAAVLRLLADRHRNLTALRTRTVCRLHALLRELIPGGGPLRVRTDRAAQLLRGVRTDNAVTAERKRMAQDLLADVRRLDRDIAAIKIRVAAAVDASGTTLTELFGVGPLVAAIVIGQVGDPRRFPTRDRFAAYNATAPIDASSGPLVRHRLNQRGNRRLNNAMHLIAVTQISHDTPGRAYFDRRLAERTSKKEALRALKRHISDAVWRQLQADLEPR